MNDSKLRNCAFVKTLLMLSVILDHSFAFWTNTWFTGNPAIQSKSLGLLSTWFGSFHVYAFALVSGYIFAYKILIGGYAEYLPFLKSKAKRLLIPYAFTALVWVAPISAIIFSWSPAELVKKFILCINPSQLWFLWMLFDVFAIVWPLKNLLMRGNPRVGWIAALIFYCVGIFGEKTLPNLFCVWTACQFIPFFYLGMRIRIKEGSREKDLFADLPLPVLAVIDAALFWGMLYTKPMSGVLWSLSYRAMSFILHFVGAIMAFRALQLLAGKLKWHENHRFMSLSAYSLPMYLFHQQIIYFTILWLNGKVNPYVNAGVNFAIAFTGSLIISHILMKWNATRILLGEKPIR